MHSPTRDRSVAETLQSLADRSLLIALFLTFFVALLLGVVNGWARGSDLAYKIGWSLFAVAVVCVEFGAIKKAVYEWRRGHHGVAVMAVVVGVMGLILSAFATFNSALSNLDQAKVAAQRKDDGYNDARSAKAKAEAKVEAERRNVDQLRAALAASVPAVGGRPVTTVAAAKELVDKAKSDRFWDRTEGCTKTLGAATSKHCAEYREALAAVAALGARSGEEANLKAAEARMADAETAVAAAAIAATAAPPVVSRDSPFVRSLQRYTGMDREEASLIEAGLPSLIMQVFLMLLGLISAGSPQRMDEEMAMPRAYGGQRAQVVRVSPPNVNVEIQQHPTANIDPFGMALARFDQRRAAAA